MKVIYFLGQLLFIPHILLFLIAKNKQEIRQDLYARKKELHGGSKLVYDLTLELLTSRYFRTLFYYRTPGMISKIVRIFYPKHTSFTIDVHTKIGGGVHLAHPYATIINAHKIGANLYINHLVTIGEIDGEKPIIGNNVQLHAGCIVIGGITIGNNAIIGAGAVVVKDVPENAIAVGNPARIIDKKSI